MRAERMYTCTNLSIFPIIINHNVFHVSYIIFFFSFYITIAVTERMISVALCMYTQHISNKHIKNVNNKRRAVEFKCEFLFDE